MAATAAGRLVLMNLMFVRLIKLRVRSIFQRTYTESFNVPFVHTIEMMPNAAFRLKKDDLQPQNETWSSKRCALPPPLSSHTENHAATSVLPQKRRFRRHESARTSPARTSATPAASITSGARREASTAAIGALGTAASTTSTCTRTCTSASTSRGT